MSGGSGLITMGDRRSSPIAVIPIVIDLESLSLPDEIKPPAQRARIRTSMAGEADEFPLLSRTVREI